MENNQTQVKLGPELCFLNMCNSLEKKNTHKPTTYTTKYKRTLFSMHQPSIENTGWLNNDRKKITNKPTTNTTEYKRWKTKYQIRNKSWYFSLPAKATAKDDSVSL